MKNSAHAKHRKTKKHWAIPEEVTRISALKGQMPLYGPTGPPVTILLLGSCATGNDSDFL